jgi:hypothetical protein
VVAAVGPQVWAVLARAVELAAASLRGVSALAAQLANSPPESGREAVKLADSLAPRARMVEPMARIRRVHAAE